MTFDRHPPAAGDDHQDDRLIEAFRRGDAQAFETLWHRYEAVVDRQIRLTGIVPPDAVDDISQYEDIAQLLGCPRGTVESRLFRARQKLRQLLASRDQPRTTVHDGFGL